MTSDSLIVFLHAFSFVKILTSLKYLNRIFTNTVYSSLFKIELKFVIYFRLNDTLTFIAQLHFNKAITNVTINIEINISFKYCNLNASKNNKSASLIA